MTALKVHLVGMVDVGTTTLVVIGLMCAASVWVIRNHLANALTGLIAFPLMFGLALAANYGLQAFGVFDPKKMSDWMICSISAVTIGVMLSLTVIVASAYIWERQEVPA